MGNAVNISGMPVRGTQLLGAVIATGAGDAVDGVNVTKTYFASGFTTAGSGAAVVVVEGSMDGVSWDTIGTITLTLSATPSAGANSDSFTSHDRYRLVRGNVSSISGTNAQVSLAMGS